jgi:hypothetical protein
MALKEKFQMYFKKTGIKRNWIAEKIGCSLPQLTNAANEGALLPLRCWYKLIEISSHHFVLRDLIENKYKRYAEIEVMECDDAYTCMIRIKKPSE